MPADGRTRFAGKVVNRLQALEALVQDMLRFVRIGPADGGSDVFEVLPLLAELEAVVQPQLADKSLQWQADVTAAGWVQGRRAELQGALVNLLENACEHAPVGSAVTLHSSISGEFYVIRVIDQGKGVPEQVESQIFDPFFTTRATGTGLGLAIVKRVAEDMKGRINYTRDERGTVFELALPLVPAVQTS